MGYTLSKTAPSKGDPTAKNRVWDFFGEPSNPRPENRRQSQQLRRKNRPTATRTASGIPYWLSRDPIGEEGGVNLYGFVTNNPIFWYDILGGRPDHMGALRDARRRRERQNIPTPPQPGNDPTQMEENSANDEDYYDDDESSEEDDECSEGSVIGRVWNLPNTIVGLGWGYLGVLGGGDWPNFGNNAIEFPNHPFMGTGITLGNTIHYADGYNSGGPYSPEVIGDHERQHTYQGELLGPLYLPSNILGLSAGQLLNGSTHGPANWNERGPQSVPPRPW